jgi:hypothetical protein
MLQTIYISVKTKSHFNIKKHSVQSWSWAKDSIGFHFLTSLQLIFSSLLCDLNPMINWTWKLNVHCLYLLLYHMKVYSWHMLYIKGRLVVDTSYLIKWSSQLIHFIIYITVCFLSLYVSNFLKSMNIHVQCYNPVLLSDFLTYRILNKSTTMGDTSGTGTAFSSCASEFMPYVSGVRGVWVHAQC